MTAAEQGFLLLTSHLGDPQRKILTVAQLRKLFSRVNAADRQTGERELTCQDVVALGYDRENAQRIVDLLNQHQQLDWYVKRAEKAHCIPITRASARYPSALRGKLGLDCPGCIWARGDVSLLELPAIALVGSRELKQENQTFAIEVGKQAARQGYVLVSGNAAGADKAAQEACLASGGKVICVVADQLDSHEIRDNQLFLSEDSFDMPFTPQRALSRNRIIHALGQMAFVAQCAYGKGGTWDGTTQNLRHNYSPVFCFADGSRGIDELICMGATSVPMVDLTNLSSLKSDIQSFL